jgi:hypothetical protein
MKTLTTILTIALLGYAYPILAVSLLNPLEGQETDPRIIIGKVIKGLLGIIGSVALVIFMYGGFVMILSIGEYSKVQKGRDMIIYAALGMAIVFSSYALVNFVLEKLIGA